MELYINKHEALERFVRVKTTYKYEFVDNTCVTFYIINYSIDNLSYREVQSLYGFESGQSVAI